MWGYVIFVCMPFLIAPFWYWLIFGSYRTGFSELIAMAAMVKVAYDLGVANYSATEQVDNERELSSDNLEKSIR